MEIVISIHAPLAGCDFAAVMPSARLRLFQSTYPLRGATRRTAAVRALVKISIHAPLAGCDRIMRTPARRGHGISIHAPLAGCDSRCRP